ncbi:MAG: hypothetical protein QXT26_03585 [Thermoproteota archaeon]
MKVVRAISKIVGLLQAFIGVTSLIFAFLLFYNFFNIQAVFGFPGENMELYMLVFMAFGLFSVVSGLMLYYE